MTTFKGVKVISNIHIKLLFDVYMSYSITVVLCHPVTLLRG